MFDESNKSLLIIYLDQESFVSLEIANQGWHPFFLFFGGGGEGGLYCSYVDSSTP